MSRENVDLARVVHEGWARGDFGAGVDLLAPDFSWDQHREAIERGSRRGAAIPESIRRIFEVYENYRISADEFIDAGDQVIVVGRGAGVARASRIEMDQRFAFLWTVRDGKLVRLQVFTQREQAIEAAGLEELATRRGP